MFIIGIQPKSKTLGIKDPYKGEPYAKKSMDGAYAFSGFVSDPSSVLCRKKSGTRAPARHADGGYRAGATDSRRNPTGTGGKHLPGWLGNLRKSRHLL
jgi:hypothetical protein